VWAKAGLSLPVWQRYFLWQQEIPNLFFLGVGSRIARVTDPLFILKGGVVPWQIGR